MPFERGRGRLGLFIMTSPKGIARDVNVWRGDGPKNSLDGGNPRETMVLVSAVWLPPRRQGSR